MVLPDFRRKSSNNQPSGNTKRVANCSGLRMNSISRIHDISLEISERMLVYPNNTPPRIRFTRLMPEGNSNLSVMILGSHTGTHVDSLLHVKSGAPGVANLPLNSLIGPSRVLDLTRVEESIKARDLVHHKIRKGEIILLKTKNSLRGYEKFHHDFIYLREDAAEYLVKRRLKTLGHDYLSVQKFMSGNVNAHRILLEGTVTIFEGLDLSKISPGSYWFMGFPLRVASEASPARVLLLER